jgi:hypothetical protein
MIQRSVVSESTTLKLVGTLKDESGALINGASLSTMSLTLYNVVDNAIINSRNAQSILNTNGGTIDGSGNWTLTLSPADNTVMDQSAASEDHVAIIKWTYSSGPVQGGVQSYSITVVNHKFIPGPGA